jgi:hypothetical protein
VTDDSIRMRNIPPQTGLVRRSYPPIVDAIGDESQIMVVECMLATGGGTMSYITGPVTKRPPIDMLDAQFGGTADNFMPHYEMALQRLGAGAQPPASLADLAAARVGQADADHFAQDWLQSWWPQAQPIEPILRQGLIEAIQQGQAARIPMSALWVVAAASDEFEVVISTSPQQVTLLIITPPPPVDPQNQSLESTGVTTVLRKNGQIVTDPSAPANG